MADNPAYQSMIRYSTEAVEFRDQIYQGDQEAVEALRFSRRKPTAHEVTAAKQSWRGSAVCKEFVENNRWNMQQAMMFGIASIAHSALGILSEVRQIRQMMEKK